MASTTAILFHRQSQFKCFFKKHDGQNWRQKQGECIQYASECTKQSVKTAREMPAPKTIFDCFSSSTLEKKRRRRRRDGRITQHCKLLRVASTENRRYIQVYYYYSQNKGSSQLSCNYTIGTTTYVHIFILIQIVCTVYTD